MRGRSARRSRASCSRSTARSSRPCPRSCWLLDVPVDDPQWERLDPPQRRQRTLDGVKRLLLRESQSAAARWWCSRTCTGSTPRRRRCSTASWRACRRRALLLLVNYRPEYSTPGAARPTTGSSASIRCRRQSAAELLDGLLGDDHGLEPLKHAPDRAHGGQPVLPRGERAGAGGDRRARRRARGLPPGEAAASHRRCRRPSQAVLAARIDRLPPEEKRLLQAASVIGKDVPVRAAGGDRRAARGRAPRGLAQLQAAEFLYETSLFPELEYTFKHALTHEVAYGSLLRSAGARSTRASSTRSSDCYADRLGEQVERLAHHAMRGEAGRRPSPISTRPGPRRRCARPTRRPSRTSRRGSTSRGSCRPAVSRRGRSCGCSSRSDRPSRWCKGFGVRGGRENVLQGARARRAGRRARGAFPGLVGTLAPYDGRERRIPGGTPHRRGARGPGRASWRQGALAGGAPCDGAEHALGRRARDVPAGHCEQGMALYDRDQHRIPGLSLRRARPRSLLSHALEPGPVAPRVPDGVARARPYRPRAGPGSRPPRQHRQCASLCGHRLSARGGCRVAAQRRGLHHRPFDRAWVRPVAGVRKAPRRLDPGGAGTR